MTHLENPEARHPARGRLPGARWASLLGVGLAVLLVDVPGHAVAPRPEYREAGLPGLVASARRELQPGQRIPHRAVTRPASLRPVTSVPRPQRARSSASLTAAGLGSPSQLDSAGSGDAAARVPRPLAPRLVIAFDGTDQANSGVTPADANLAAGPSQVVTVVNTAWAAYDKLGAQVIPEIQLADWWLPVFDDFDAFYYTPKVIYDQHHRRFVLICVATDFNLGLSQLLISVSPVGTPFGVWTLFNIDARLNGSQLTSNFMDESGLAVDRAALYITGNMFDFATNGFRYAKVFLIDKLQLYAGRIRGSTVWDLIDAWNEHAYGIQPAHVFGVAPTGFLVCTRFPGGDVVSGITIWYVSSPTNRPRLSRRLVPTDFYTTPPPGLQPDDVLVQPVFMGNGRLYNAVYRNGYIYTANSTGIDWGDFAFVSAIHYVQINTGSARLVRELYYGATLMFYGWPMIMADGFNNLALIFNRCAQDQYVQLRYTGRRSFDRGSFLQDSALLVPGNGELLMGQPGLAYLGFNNGIALDPNNQRLFWMNGMYAKDEDFWGTAAAAVTF